MPLVISALVLMLLILIIILKEFISTISRLKTVKNELKKFNPLNTYEVKKLLTLIQQSNKILKNSSAIEEKLHWYEILIKNYKKIKNYTPLNIHDAIEKEIETHLEAFNSLKKTLSNSSDNKTS